jgi:DNA polymerase-3 subunit alpha
MGITTKLKNWLDNNFVTYDDIGYGRISIPNMGVMIEFVPQNEFHNTFSTEEKLMSLNITQNVVDQILDDIVQYVIFEFGGSYFYTPISHIFNVKLKMLRYLGKYNDQNIPDKGRAFLGIHGRYEMMNGTRNYKDWCEKASFLKFKALGICEKGTLAGTLPFQIACKKAKIKPIIGSTVEVENEQGLSFDVKLYAIDNVGWRNLLKINKIVNIDNDGFIKQSDLLNSSKGLVCVLFPSSAVDKLMISQYKKVFSKVFYQITTNKYRSEVKDRELLDNMKLYLDKMSSDVEPILISDAYCLDKEDTHIREVLNKQGKTQFTNSSSNHYFRSFDEQFEEFEPLFREDDNRLEDVFFRGFNALQWMIDNCNFEIETNKLFLPEYEMTLTEQAKYTDKNDLFVDLIEEGLDLKFSKDINGPNGDQALDELIVRIKYEKSVIEKGGFVDYFLILWDIVNWCKTKNIQTGPGRGSAAGCLISYLLGIVKINPLEYGLIFERFLNESRIENELPDIDIDFASDRRDEVIEYMQNRYGHDYVCRVGTYGTLQMKGVLKELARAYGTEGEKYNMNFVTTLINADNENWEPLFGNAIEEPLLKKFVLDNPKIVNDARIALNSIKSASMHACATIIVPKLIDEEGKVMSIYEQLPVRKDDGGMLISEWEGDILAEAGFLKEDILSTKQMAKIGHIFDLVKERNGVQLDMETIPLDDPNVYDLFQKGFNQDVFHFGSSGLTNYLREVQPENIDELIASIALYRPGAMASNAHTDFVKLKKGILKPDYDFLLEDVTKDTYGLYIYQEQIMKAAQVLGDFTLAEADGVRKAMGKKIKEKMDSYKVQFVDKAIDKGCLPIDAENIWNKMEVFAGYGFNKSHAAAYSVIGYYCNWLKFYYPLEFWTVAFQFVDNKKIQDFVAEIKRMGHIEIVSPDINKSHLEFYSDPIAEKIYWNLSQIKYVGPAAAEAIIECRNKDGKFFSVEEFHERLPGRSVNKRTVEHLIFAGCFDEMYAINRPHERLKIFEEYYKLLKGDLPKELLDNKKVDHYWSIRQSEVSKLSDLDYHQLIRQTQFTPFHDEYITSEEYTLTKEVKRDVMIIGTITDAKVSKTKTKKEYAVIKLMQDEYPMQVRVWSDELIDGDSRFADLKQFVESNQSRLCVFRGTLERNDYINGNELVLRKKIKGPIYEYF